jgi:hypothetical protein
MEADVTSWSFPVALQVFVSRIYIVNVLIWLQFCHTFSIFILRKYPVEYAFSINLKIAVGISTPVYLWQKVYFALYALRRTVSSGMLRHVALVRTDVSEELCASIRVTRLGELGTTLAVTSNRHVLRRNTK